MEDQGNQNSMPNGNNSQLKAIAGFVWDLVKIVIVALVIIVPFRTFVAEPFVVSGSSMLPNFHNRDYLIIDRISYRTHQPQRGDVVVLKFPKDTSQFFIKRIIGLPGEQIKLQQGHVMVINKQYPEGKVLSEPYLPSQIETIGQQGPVNLGSEEYFVLGDNRTASSDSRVWGILPASDIVGKVWLKVFSLNRLKFERFRAPEYSL